MQITNRINKINSKKPYFNRDKQKRYLVSKRSKDDIVRAAKRVKHQALYVRITSILNVKLDVIIDDEIRVTYDCVIKIT